MRPWLRYADKFFCLFDAPQGIAKGWLRLSILLFVILVTGISAMFLRQALMGARNNDLWLDERNGINTRSASYADLITGSMASQVSRAPLDYIGQKFFDQIAGHWLSARLPPNIYYRLNSIFYIWLSGLFITLFIFAKLCRTAQNYLVLFFQMGLLAAALFHYYFWHENFRYWIQMRPYALWCSLWFMILSLFLVEGRLRVWPFLVLFALLAATANAAIYQLFSFALAFMTVQSIQREKVSGAIRTVLKVFAVPAMISLYYILVDYSTIYVWRSNSGEYFKEFFRFWFTKEMIPILSALGIFLTAGFEKLRHITIVFLAMLILYLISPAINYIVLLRGVFFSSRHYIYYDLIYAVFCAALAVALPVFIEKIKKQS